MKTGRKIEMNGENSVEGRVAPVLVGAHMRAPPIDIKRSRLNLRRQGVG